MQVTKLYHSDLQFASFFLLCYTENMKIKPVKNGLRSPCPIANTLDILGDKWTLLIIRDMVFMKKTRYKDFADSPESIPTNILASRLKKMEKEKIITKKAYQTNPVRYEYHLTQKGKDLRPILLNMMKWSDKHL